MLAEVSDDGDQAQSCSRTAARMNIIEVAAA